MVTTHGVAFAEGVLEGGLVPVAKHFPGHGRANADSHAELATTPGLEELRMVDLLPFGLVPEGSAVMVGHLAVPGLTDGVPASLSAAAVTGILRGEMGFDGVVVTDDLSMGAVAQLVRRTIGRPVGVHRRCRPPNGGTARERGSGGLESGLGR